MWFVCHGLPGASHPSKPQGARGIAPPSHPGTAAGKTSRPIVKKETSGEAACRAPPSSIFPEDIRDILVTHEGPGEHPYGVEVIDELAQTLGARTLLHGHYHDPSRYGSSNRIYLGLRECLDAVTTSELGSSPRRRHAIH